jgi:tetratricopeptide (TPR) repeat protein
MPTALKTNLKSCWGSPSSGTAEAITHTRTRDVLIAVGFVIVAFAISFPATADPTDLVGLDQRLRALVNKGDNAAALKVAQSLVSSVTAIHGADHLETARCLCEEARLHAANGSYSDAVRIYHTALGIREKRLGSEDPSVADVLVAIAETLQADARSEEATSMLRRAVAIREDKLGAEHQDTADALNRLGASLFSNDKYVEAGTCFERCLVAYENTLGPTHLDTALALSNLSVVHQERDNYKIAQLLEQRAFAIRQELLGKDHEDTVGSSYRLGILLFIEGNNEQSERLLAHVLAFRKSRFGAEDPQLPEIARLLIAIYRAQHKQSEAMSLEQEFGLADDAAPQHDDGSDKSGTGT